MHRGSQHTFLSLCEKLVVSSRLCPRVHCQRPYRAENQVQSCSTPAPERPPVAYVHNIVVFIIAVMIQVMTVTVTLRGRFEAVDVDGSSSCLVRHE